MPTPSTAVWPKPRSEDEFEDITVDFLRVRWKDPNAQRHGRRGQAQHGVDIVGHPPRLGGKPAGGQCKNTNSLALADVIKEIDKAKAFPGGIAEFYVVTSGDRDAKLQTEVREYLASNPAPFVVALVFWDDIVADVSTVPSLVDKHWKGFSDGVAAGSNLTSATNLEDDAPHDEEEWITSAPDQYQGVIIEQLLRRVTREDFERILVGCSHGELLHEVAEDTSYATLVRFAVTRAIVGGWIGDFLRMVPSEVSDDPRLRSLHENIHKYCSGASSRRRRVALLLQHMARLEGQQVQTPGYLWIAHGHESGHQRSDDEEENPGGTLSDYMGVIDLESIRDHLHGVLETTLRLIAELDADTVIAEEVPDAYVALMSGLNARAKILRHALRFGASERAAADYRRLIAQREAAVERLVQRLLKRD